jgi:hypothetical protein
MIRAFFARKEQRAGSKIRRVASSDVVDDWPGRECTTRRHRPYRGVPTPTCMLLAAIALAACGPEGEDPGSAVARPGTAASTVPAARPSESAAAGSVDPFRRHDPLPAGVDAQLEFFEGGGGDCLDDSTVYADPTFRVTVNPPDTPLTIPGIHSVCIANRDLGKAATIFIYDPSDRLVERAEFPPGSIADVGFLRLPGDVPGVYRLVARQGDTETSRELPVVSADEPILLAVTDDGHGRPTAVLTNIKAGATVTVALGGFPPDSTVQIRLYGGKHKGRNGRKFVDYATSLPARVGADGSGLLKIATSPDSPAGCYVLASEYADRRVQMCLGPS